MKVAIVHDWLVTQRGGEHVLDAICELFPKADLFTLVFEPGRLSSNILRLNRHVSVLRHIPSATRRYRHLLPLMPWAIEQFDLNEYDLILSSSHCVAKGVRKRADAFHMSYTHAPMRYMWDRFDSYFSKGNYAWPTRAAARLCRPWLQNWDARASERVDHFLANSKFIAEKIQAYYQRQAAVVYPFCDLNRLAGARGPQSIERVPGRNYLIVTALVPYKRVDLAIEAFNRTKKPLLIVGDGPDRDRLAKQCGPTIEFLGGVKNSTLLELYAKCRALVFPGVEDFGIVPLEAMAAGAPVIALGLGGALETVTPETGVFFPEESVEGLISGIEEFERRSFDPESCRKQAALFSRARFQREYLNQLIQRAPAKIVSSLEIQGIAIPPDQA